MNQNSDFEWQKKKRSESSYIIEVHSDAKYHVSQYCKSGQVDLKENLVGTGI